MAQDKSFSVTEADAYLIARAIEVKIAQVKRALNAADDSDMKSVLTKQMVAYVDLQRKFPPLVDGVGLPGVGPRVLT